MKKLAAAIAAAVVVAATLSAPTAADASVHHTAKKNKTVCQKGSGTHSGRCWKLLKTKKKLVVMEAIPLENKTRHKKANMHCSFSRTISRTVEVGGEVSSSVEAGVFKVVNVNITATVHRNVSQTAEEASSAGGDITLKPGESVVCQRTYGYVVARVRQYTWSGGKSEYKILKSKIPANLGVRIVD